MLGPIEMQVLMEDEDVGPNAATGGLLLESDSGSVAFLLLESDTDSTSVLLLENA